MKTLKRMLVAFMVVAMILPMTVFAAESPVKKSIADADAAVKTVTFNKEKQNAEMTIVVDGETLVEGTDFVIVKGKTRKNAGTITVKAQGIGKYEGTVVALYTVKKADQTIKVTGKKTAKASVLKEKNVTLKLNTKVNGNAEVTYKSYNKKISVNANGKVTLKKGLKAGTYSIRVKVAATKNYKAAYKMIKITVK